MVMHEIAVPSQVHTVGFPDIQIHDGLTGAFFEVLVTEDDTPGISVQWGAALGEELAKLRDIPLVVDDWSGGGGSTQSKDGMEAGYAWSETAWTRDVHAVMPSGHMTEVLINNPDLDTGDAPNGVTGTAVDPTVGASHLYVAAGRYILKLTNGVDAGPILAPFFDLESVRSGATAVDMMEFDEAIYLGTEKNDAADFLWRMAFGTSVFNGMRVESVTILNPGVGYTDSTYPLVFTGGGFAVVAEGTVTISGGAVVSTNVTVKGSGYTSNPTVTIGGSPGSPSTAAELEANIAPKVAQLARVFWEIENAEGVYTGAHRLVGGRDRTIHHLMAEGGSGVNGLDESKWAGPITLDGFGMIRSFAAAPRHVYAAAQTGIYDIDTLGNTPNLTPHLARRRDDVLNGACSLFHGGYVYYTTPRGLERVYVGDQLLHEERLECGPGAGLSNETPVYGIAGQGYNPFALTSDGPWILFSQYNGTDSYVSSGIDRRTSHRPSGPTPMIWNIGELYLPGERITHMRLYSPLTGLPRLWLFSIDGDGRIRMRWVPMPSSPSLLQELRTKLDSGGNYTGDYRWATIARVYQTKLDAGDDNARKVALRWDARTLNVNTDSFIRVFARDEHETNWRQQGTGGDPRMQRTPRSELLPYTAGTDQITMGHALETRVDLVSPDSNGAFGSGAAGTALMGISLAIADEGSGYTDGTHALVIAAPPVGGRQATATVTVAGGEITTVTVTDRGSGYLAPPAVSFPGGMGAGADGALSVSLAVDGVRIDDEGSGYATAPRVRFRGVQTVPASTANAGVTVGSDPLNSDTYQKVSAITITANGAGYTEPPDVEFYGTGSVTPPIVRQLQLRTELVQELREARTYLVPIRTGRSQRDGAIDMADAEAILTQVARLQTNAPVKFLDEIGVERTVRVEPGMKYRWLRYRPEGSRQFIRELVLTLELSIYPTDPSDLQLDTASTPPPSGIDIDPLGFRWGDGTRWGEGKLYT